MKNVPIPEFPGDEADEKLEEWFNHGDKIYCSYRERAEDLLPRLDRLLEPFGLEIVQYETGSTDILWGIFRRD